MKKSRLIPAAGVLLFLIAVGLACQKKGDFINENKLGSGIHYFPLLLNESYSDTITHKRFSDTTFSSGQKIIFEIKYFSQDSIDQIELWISGSDGKKQQKVWSTPYNSNFYSSTQKCDTTFINATLPKLSDTTEKGWVLSPTVVTKKGLSGSSHFTVLKR